MICFKPDVPSVPEVPPRQNEMTLTARYYRSKSYNHTEYWSAAIN
jgi:hypothetical protein